MLVRGSWLLAPAENCNSVYLLFTICFDVQSALICHTYFATKPYWKKHWKILNFNMGWNQEPDSSEKSLWESWFLVLGSSPYWNSICVECAQHMFSAKYYCKIRKPWISIFRIFSMMFQYIQYVFSQNISVNTRTLDLLSKPKIQRYIHI